MSDLLIELFSEEIPARMQARAREDLKSLVTNGLVEAGLTYASAGAFSTPRRLTLAIDGLSPQSQPVREERKGPAATAPQAAIEGFLRSTGLTLDQLERRADKKGETLYAIVEKPGRPAADIIAEVLETTIRSFPWPKSMRWGAGTLRWVRPLQSILCLMSDEGGSTIVPLTVDGITAANTTEGHRFLSPGRFAVTGFDDYAVKLKRAHVVLDSAEREAAIWQGAQNLAFAAGLELVEDKGLLAEVAGLVEWPVPLMGRIADDFLHLPPEVLQTSMKEHQKFFSVKNPKTGRIEGFVTVANTQPADHGATILKGNQKVLTARLSDARFFYDNDLRVARAGPESKPMGEWLDGLKSVTFHNKLGSQADRIARIAALAREIAPLVGADADLAEQAANLAKADLRSAMVGEFPELQGTMGRYYALEAGEPEAVAAVEMLRDLMKSGAHANIRESESGDAFMSGSLGMILTTSVYQRAFLNAAKDKFELRAAKMPSFGDKPARPTNSGSALFIMSKDPAKQRAAWELVKYMTSKRGYTVITSKIGYLPLRLLPPPVKIPVMREFMLWHRSMDGDPMHRWLRERISDVIQCASTQPDALRATA